MGDIFWNGLGVTVPGSWEPSAIERDALSLSKSERPRCELKWSRVQGRFSFDKHIAKIVRANKGAQITPLEETATPDAWTRAIIHLGTTGFTAMSFGWTAPDGDGLGATLYNADTGMAALARFPITSKDDENTAAEVLSSLRDVGMGKTVPWAMFGLSARVPAEYNLHTFSFKPGHYRVAYWKPKTANSSKSQLGKGPGSSLVFDRYAPASVLLKGTDLKHWTKETVDNAPSGLTAGGERVSWSEIGKASFFTRLFNRARHTQGQVWTTQTGNAILSVVAHGIPAVPAPQFKNIIESYQLVQEETA